MIAQLLVSLAIITALTFVIFKFRKARVNMTQQQVLITGGAHGIGWDLALLLLDAGAAITIFDINEPPSTNDRLKFRKVDVGDHNAVQQAVSELRAPPTVLVNNAGVHSNGKRLDQLTASAIKRVIDTNLMGVIWCTKACLPHMQRQETGHVISVASCLGLGGLNNVSDYCASKFGVIGFTESLRLELKVNGYTGILVTTVCPFLVKTGMFAGLRIAHPWLTPPLETRDVSQTIFDCIRYRNREEIWLPTFVNFFPIFRLFPCSIYDRVQQLLGSCSSFIYDDTK